MSAALLAERQEGEAREVAASLQRKRAQNSDEEAADRVEAGTDSPDPESAGELAR